MTAWSRRDALTSTAAAWFAMGTGGAVAQAATAREAAASIMGTWHPLARGSARYVEVSVQLGGRNLPAIVDTGTTQSLIDGVLAGKLGLIRAGAAQAATFTGPVTGAVYMVDGLKVDGIPIANLAMASYDLTTLEASLGRPVPIILGQDVLGRLLLDADFPYARLRLLDGVAGVDTSGFRQVALSPAPQFLPVVDVLLTGGTHADAVLDLGSNVTCSVSSSFAREHDLSRGRSTSTTMTAGVEGVQVSPLFILPSMEIGGFRLREVPVCIVDNWRLDQPVNLGWPALRSFELLLQLATSKLWLRPEPALLALPLPKDRLGIGASRSADRMVVQHVASNSPAEKAGLKQGDVVTMVDGRRISPSYPEPGSRQGERPAGTHLTLGLADGRSVPLTLADYF